MHIEELDSSYRSAALAVADALNGSGVIRLVEHPRTTHDGVGAGFDHLPGISTFDATVDFDPGVEPFLFAHPAQITDLLHLIFDEALASEARVHAHDQHQITELEAVLEGVKRSAGVQHSSGHLAEILDLGEVAVQVGASLNLYGNDVGAGLGEVGDVLLRLNDHQMHVQGLLGHRTQRFNDQRTDGDVGHEAAVHHVHVNPVSTGLVHRLDLFAEAGEVGREDGWGDHQWLGAHGGIRVNAGRL